MVSAKIVPTGYIGKYPVGVLMALIHSTCNVLLAAEVMLLPKTAA